MRNELSSAAGQHRIKGQFKFAFELYIKMFEIYREHLGVDKELVSFAGRLRQLTDVETEEPIVSQTWPSDFVEAFRISLQHIEARTAEKQLLGESTDILEERIKLIRQNLEKAGKSDLISD